MRARPHVLFACISIVIPCSSCLLTSAPASRSKRIIPAPCSPPVNAKPISYGLPVFVLLVGVRSRVEEQAHHSYPSSGHHQRGLPDSSCLTAPASTNASSPRHALPHIGTYISAVTSTPRSALPPRRGASASSPRRASIIPCGVHQNGRSVLAPACWRPLPRRRASASSPRRARPPYRAPIISAVHPPLSCLFTSAPASRSARIMSRRARYRIVCPHHQRGRPVLVCLMYISSSVDEQAYHPRAAARRAPSRMAIHQRGALALASVGSSTSVRASRIICAVPPYRERSAARSQQQQQSAAAREQQQQQQGAPCFSSSEQHRPSSARSTSASLAAAPRRHRRRERRSSTLNTAHRLRLAPPTAPAAVCPQQQLVMLVYISTAQHLSAAPAAPRGTAPAARELRNRIFFICARRGGGRARASLRIAPRREINGPAPPICLLI